MEQQPEAAKDANRSFWDMASARWRELGLPEADKVRPMLESLDCPAGGLVLDAGCGPGLWSIALAEAGYRVCGGDLSPQMVAEARRKSEEYGVPPGAAQFEVADIEHLPFEDSLFDAVICRNVLGFAPNPGVALVELRRVLRPGRRLVLFTLGAYSPVNRESWRRFLPGSTFPKIANYITPWEVEALLGELGWRIIEQKAHFGASVAGVSNAYNQETFEKLTDRVLQQTIATSWEFVALKTDTPSSHAG